MDGYYQNIQKTQNLIFQDNELIEDVKKVVNQYMEYYEKFI